MNPSTQRAALPPHADRPGPTSPDSVEESGFEPGPDEMAWSEAEAEPANVAAGGRAVLGGALSLLALLWIGFAGWAAGRALAGQSLSAPALAQWLAIATGPLALLGLAWIMFGRTRRRESERFTRSVIAMRTEAKSLEGLLGVLTRRIDDLDSWHRQLDELVEQPRE